MRLYELLDRGCRENPDGIAFTDGIASLTYRETRSAADRVARRLHVLGLGRDDVVAVCAPNHLLTFVAVLGILRAGCLWLPINARNGRDEIAHALDTHETRFLFHHSSLVALVEPLARESDSLRGTCLIDGEASDPATLPHWIAAGDDRPVYPEQAPDDVVAIRSTGGTTGPSKGVMISSRNYAMLFASFLSCIALPPRPVHLAAAPLSHAAGSLALLTLARGGTNVVLPKAVPEEILAAIERHGVNLVFLPPTVIYMLLSSPRLADHNYASLRCLVYAGAPMSVDRLQQALAAFGPVLLQGYGQAEAPFFCTCLTPEDHLVGDDPKRRKRLESCGRATLFTDVAVMDDDGKLLADGETGEIVIRGDIVMKGYYRNPTATAEVSRFGWHHTGDVGYRDASGYFYIVDRKRDLIISGGFNISPAEIERVLWSHEAVQDCVVIGVPDETWGEVVKAVVELKPGASVAEEELMALCAERLGRMKRPRSIEFWPELPRSPVGKVLKRDIRARYWAAKGRAI